ncbi:oxidoreductase [Streptomyces sp. SID3343]|uniref:oxidoreductase n=1 Tax=Streptomyces sp. SID3343 TaxID=2690260 RepID=UPI00136DE443|nr:oxidoreductase [Streptomyces sp. SID3343]MYW03943.1 oxidoreductase [Streptomyces sp. SID3343]
MSTPPPHLTASELRLWEAYRRGERLDLGAGVAADDDPRNGAVWGGDRVIRASVLARLLLQPPEPEPGHTTALRITGALVTGRLELGGGRLDAYISWTRCRFEKPITLNVASTVTILAHECVIPALYGRNLRVDGDLSLTCCVVPSGIRILDARIDNDLRIDDCVVGPGEYDRAVFGNGLQVGADASFNRSVLTGQVSLHGARFGGPLLFPGARIERPGALALDLGRISVEHSLFITAGFSVVGSIRLNDARTGGAIVLSGGVACANPDEELTLWRAVANGFHLALSAPALGRIVLNGASVGILTDTPHTWPPRGNLEIAELTYTTRRAASPATVSDRIDWVERGTADYAPQPYDQLAGVYRAAGEDEDARSVLLAKQRRRRDTLGVPGRLWGHVQDVAIGYGYRPARALGWLIALVAVGTAVFAADRPAPLKADEAPHWNPFWYTLDLLLPVVTLGQDSAWKPTGPTQWLAYTLILLGWVLAGAAAAGATRVLNRA